MSECSNCLCKETACITVSASSFMRLLRVGDYRPEAFRMEIHIFFNFKAFEKFV